MSANDNLKKMLETSRKLSNGTLPKTSAPQRPQITEAERNNYITQFDQQVNQIDNAVYGPYKPKEGVYDPDAELEQIKQGRKPVIDVNASNLPKSIYESILADPLDTDPSLVQDARVNAFAQRLGQQSQGLQKVAGLQGRLDEADKKAHQEKVAERLANYPTNGGGANIDYSLLKTIIEGIVSEKMTELKKEITDALRGIDECKVMAFKNGKFLYITEDNKVYECNTVYKGVNKG